MNSFASFIQRAARFPAGWELGWLGLLIVLTLLPATLAFAAHPLITEDTATQGQGNGQLELALTAGGSFATGDEAQGLGVGKSNLGVNLVASYETDTWGGHLHLGFLRAHVFCGTCSLPGWVSLPA